MNSIQAVEAPERDQAQGKAAERGKSVGKVAPPKRERSQAKAKPDDRPRQPLAEIVRLYTREGNRYELQLESADFNAVMKQAEKRHEQGTDILVNDKANPLHVHAKSNIHKNVVVGREISPVQRNGVYVRGKGEILLEDFYKKLPLNTPPFDKQTAEQATAEESTVHRVDADRNDQGVLPGVERRSDGPYELTVGQQGTTNKQTEIYDTLELAVRAYIKADSQSDPGKLPLLRLVQRNGETIMSPDPEEAGAPSFANKVVEAVYQREIQAFHSVDQMPLNTRALSKRSAEPAAVHKPTVHRVDADWSQGIPAGVGRRADGPYELLVSPPGTKAKQREIHDTVESAVRAYIKAESDPNIKLLRLEQRNGATILWPDPENAGAPIFQNKVVEAIYQREIQASRIVEEKRPDLVKELATDDRTAEAAGPQPEGRRVILKTSGYDLPDHVRDAYKIKSGRFYDKHSDQVRFEDHGKKLSTSIEDPSVVEHMLDVAAAKNWDHVELSGTDGFKQMAWLAASTRGIKTQGYQPTEQDQQKLEQLKRERERGASVGRGVAQDNSVEAIGSRVAGLEKALAAADAKEQQVRNDPASTDDDRMLAKEERKAAEFDLSAHAPDGVVIGRLVEHGEAQYRNDPDEKPSYYVTVRTRDGDQRTVWGKDLKRAMSVADFKVGDAISLERTGTEPVQVQANVRDDATQKVVGTQQINARRHEWQVKHAPGLLLTRQLAPNEQVRVDAAVRVLQKELQQYPEELRLEILDRFSNAVDKGELRLPMPQVAERAAKAMPTPQPEMERGR
jgi:hypothetical protein